MDLKRKNIKDNSTLKRILVLNKINHKPLLFFSIFPYTVKRPFIFPYLIDSDFALKNSLRKTIKKIKTKNFEKRSIDNLYKYVLYKYMKDTDILSLGNYMINYILNKKNTSFSFRDNYEHYIIEYFKLTKPIQKDINIPYNIIEKYILNGKEFKKFVEDYLSININLLFLPVNKNSDLNKDSLYLYDLKENNKIIPSVNLFCIINNDNFYNNLNKIHYKYINGLYFFFGKEDKYENLFKIVYFYLEKIIHKENIKIIIFDNTFSKESLIKYYTKYEIIYTKIYLENIVENYFEITKENGKIDIDLSSLEEIEFDDDNIINDIQCFKLRYNLSKIFSNKYIFKVIRITPKDYNNICNISQEEEKDLMNKMNLFAKDNTSYRILYFDFCDHSPYQTNFYYFCQKFLSFNKNINIIIIDNIGNINRDYDFFKNNNSFKKIILPSLKSIIYEKDLIYYGNTDKNTGNNNVSYKLNEQIFIFNLMDNYDNNKILENECIYFDRFGIIKFVNDFFDYSGLNVYEGYDTNYNLVYLNITKKIQINELYRIFFIENKISKLTLNNEKMQIKFNKINNEYTLIKDISKNKKQFKYNINTFDEFLKKIYLNNDEILDDKKMDIIISIGKINKILSTSLIITEKSQLDLLISGISKVLNGNIEYFRLVYQATFDKNKIDTIVNVFGRNRYVLLLVKTNKGNIFGAYTFLYDFLDYIYTEEKSLGIVFNFTDNKIYYNVKSFLYENNQGIEIKDYFYIIKPSFKMKNKIMKGLIEIGERYFICKTIEFYFINMSI